ncbi:MAG: M20 family metallopeptidase [Deltaproteobacteria bacterium]|nr:M20 family metallopeptidase [Deltaproteobacteria bacterium]
MSTPTLERALAALARRPTETLALAEKLVLINSFTENIAGVNDVAAILDRAFAPLSLTLTRIASTRFGNHLVWKTAAASKVAPIVIIGHHDTVFPPGVFEGWRVDGDRAFGPGVLDMKGGLAVVWAALAALDDAGLLVSLPIVFVTVADEEVGSPDSAPHIKNLARGAIAGLVFESGRAGDAIVTRRRGTGGLIATATGKAAHAGNAHADGANAIWALSRFVDAAQRETDYARDVTVNVGTIAGGTSKNTVPAHASCVVDLRFDTARDANALIAALSEAARLATRDVPGTTIALDGGVRRKPLERTPESASLFAEYAAHQSAAGLGDTESPLVGGGSDANTLGEIGIPVIDGLGPRGDGFHTPQEFAEISSFAPKAEALVRFLCGRLKTSE